MKPRTGMILALLLAGCRMPPVADPVPPSVVDTATAGVADPALRALLADHWARTMERSPLWATRLGDHRFDDRLDDNSEAAMAADRAATRAFLARAEAIDAGALSGEDRVTLEIFTGELRAGVAAEVCHTEQWGLSARSNALGLLGELGQGDVTAEGAAAWTARLRAFPTSVANEEIHLRRGVREGRTPERAAVEVVLTQLDAALATPVEAWAVAAPTNTTAWDAASWRAEVLAELTTHTRPALVAYRRVIAEEVLPAARDAAHAGVWALPDGAACYRALAAHETSLDLDPDTIHQIGLDSLASIHGEMRVLGKKVFGTEDLPTIFARLREDPALRFGTAEDVEAKATAALAAAKAKIPAYFGRLPQADCGVRRIPDYEAPYTTIAYYWPSVPGEAPGYYYVNTYAPETRPRFEAEVLAFHESIPGHHLQIAIAQELPALPAFRKNLGTTAFVEGWALYTERLADEMGLYTSDLDRMGMLSFDAWRAARLVVDTGIHAKKWDRERAERFFRENTPLALNNVHNEVDRYITWPGQALAYKLGQLRIRFLRSEAERALGSRFSLPAFHDVVLGGGAVPLPVLDARVRAWVAAQE